MHPPEDYIIVMTALASVEEAQKIAKLLVESSLAACVTISPRGRSVYRWQGVIQDVEEITLMAKTRRVRYSEVERAIRLHHSYELPEIIAIPLSHGYPAYLDWLALQTRDTGGDHA